MNPKTVELEMHRVTFYSSLDEEALFAWISKIGAVDRCYGKGESINLKVSIDRMDDESLRELLSLFHRYGIDMKQLRAFDDPKFSDWFRNEQSYWYGRVFLDA